MNPALVSDVGTRWQRLRTAKVARESRLLTVDVHRSCLATPAVTGLSDAGNSFLKHRPLDHLRRVNPGIRYPTLLLSY